MPAETRGNILLQVNGDLQEMGETGATTRSSEEPQPLADQVDRIHSDGWLRVNSLHHPPRVVRWEGPVDVEEEIG